MNDFDRGLVGAVCVPLLIVGGLVAGILWLGSRSQPAASDVTAEYAIDDVLPGHRLYRIEPKGIGTPIFVVTRNGEAVATKYRTPGKHGTDVNVEIVR